MSSFTQIFLSFLTVLLIKTTGAWKYHDALASWIKVEHNKIWKLMARTLKKQKKNLFLQLFQTYLLTSTAKLVLVGQTSCAFWLITLKQLRKKLIFLLVYNVLTILFKFHHALPCSNLQWYHGTYGHLCFIFDNSFT